MTDKYPFLTVESVIHQICGLSKLNNLFLTDFIYNRFNLKYIFNKTK